MTNMFICHNRRLFVLYCAIVGALVVQANTDVAAELTVVNNATSPSVACKRYEDATFVLANGYGAITTDYGNITLSSNTSGDGPFQPFQLQFASEKFGQCFYFAAALNEDCKIYVPTEFDSAVECTSSATKATGFQLVGDGIGTAEILVAAQGAGMSAKAAGAAVKAAPVMMAGGGMGGGADGTLSPAMQYVVSMIRLVDLAPEPIETPKPVILLGPQGPFPTTTSYFTISPTTASSSSSSSSSSSFTLTDSKGLPCQLQTQPTNTSLASLVCKKGAAASKFDHFAGGLLVNGSRQLCVDGRRQQQLLLRRFPEDMSPCNLLVVDRGAFGPQPTATNSSSNTTAKATSRPPPAAAAAAAAGSQKAVVSSTDAPAVDADAAVTVQATNAGTNSSTGSSRNGAGAAAAGVTSTLGSLLLLLLLLLL